MIIIIIIIITINLLHRFPSFKAFIMNMQQTFTSQKLCWRYSKFSENYVNNESRTHFVAEIMTR